MRAQRGVKNNTVSQYLCCRKIGFQKKNKIKIKQSVVLPEHENLMHYIMGKGNPGPRTQSF